MINSASIDKNNFVSITCIRNGEPFSCPPTFCLYPPNGGEQLKSGGAPKKKLGDI